MFANIIVYRNAKGYIFAKPIAKMFHSTKKLSVKELSSALMGRPLSKKESVLRLILKINSWNLVIVAL